MSILRCAVFLATSIFALGAAGTKSHASSLVVTSIADTGGDVCGNDCTLRQAINAANLESNLDAIVFDPTVFASKQTITLSDDFPIYHDVSITGPMKSGSGVTIRCTDFLRDSAVRIYSGSVALSNLTVTGANIALLVVRGQTTVTNCTFSDNATALFNVSYQRVLSADEKKLGLPTSVFGVVEELSTLTANNCTISGNMIGAYSVAGPMRLNSCTLASNETGILVIDGPLNLSNCLVVGNSKYNVFNSVDSVTKVTKDLASIIKGTSDEFGLDPKGLQNNGGPTQTIALIEGSKAIGAGEITSPTDQRGSLRPEKGQCDVGAFETQLRTPTKDS